MNASIIGGPLVELARGEGWLVVAKPPWLLVHRNPRNPTADAALQRVRSQVGSRVYPIHRLDRNTSGCLLFATRQELAGPLSMALKSEDARKTYLAFVRGWFRSEEEVRVETPIKYGEGDLRDASSVVRLLGRSQDPRCSLLEVRPRTGRHHQVRRHVRDLQHPIIGDSDHGDSRVNRWWREQMGNRRMGLHCLRLSVPLPGGGRIEATCPLFADQAGLWQRLPWWEDARLLRPELSLPPLPLDENEEPDGDLEDVAN